MKATKLYMTVKIEVLSIDAVPALLHEVAGIIRNGNTGGSLSKDDGDLVEWETQSAMIKF